MNRFIQIGGITVIVAVFGILIFIGAEAWPLFQGATVGDRETTPLRAPAGGVTGTDESGRAYFVADAQGALTFHDATGAAFSHWAPDLPEGVNVTALAPGANGNTLAIGLSDGRAAAIALNFTSSRNAAGAVATTAEPEQSEPVLVGAAGQPVEKLYFAEGGEGRVFVARQTIAGKTVLHVTRIKERRNLMGRTRLEAKEPALLGGEISAEIAHVAVTGNGGVLMADATGAVWFFNDTDEGYAPGQPPFRPFAGQSDPAIAAMGLVFGDVSLVLVGADGANVIWALTPQADDTGQIRRRWQHTKTLPDFSGGNVLFSRSQTNKSFLLTSDRTVSLRHATTASARWDAPMNFAPAAAFLGPHHDSINFLDATGSLQRHRLRDPHPEGGWKAFFGKIWYEGAARPEWTWQSSSANDDFEPKLSLMPLVFGTVKGTVYALLFSLPISLLAALYMAQFLKPEHKRVIKPVMEIMASLPSVVLGFIAALWLAPRVEQAVPGLLLAALALPATALVFGLVWSRLPSGWRRRIPPGWEFAALAPVALLSMAAAWQLGPVAERVFFTWTDPATGQVVGDFRLWWTQLSGQSFEQRNCLVVGFVMGFAVIPVVFTIAEDALSNVPRSLVSASLALGASRWQTAWRVVVPTASAGIFSGVMIGFGRAIGETMIVVMATGNTAVMDWNIFNGMRTLSANIAVELPEAAVGSTHYRTLFLGACCLFLLTFMLNTVAELLRQRLREKYKVV